MRDHKISEPSPVNHPLADCLNILIMVSRAKNVAAGAEIRKSDIKSTPPRAWQGVGLRLIAETSLKGTECNVEDINAFRYSLTFSGFWLPLLFAGKLNQSSTVLSSCRTIDATYLTVRVT